MSYGIDVAEHAKEIRPFPWNLVMGLWGLKQSQGSYLFLSCFNVVVFMVFVLFLQGCHWEGSARTMVIA